MSKLKLTNIDYCRAAERLGCEVASVKAVAQQESLGAGFDAQDRPVILFERHIFHKLTKGKYDKTHPGISNAVPGGYGPSASQYGRFSEAFDLNQTAAMESASWGKFQILGTNFAICGYSSVNAFVDAMKESEGKQLDAFCAFVLHNGLDIALTDHDWAAFADGYNGHGYRKNHYDTKIEAGYKKFSKEHIDCGTSSQPTKLADEAPQVEQQAEVAPEVVPEPETSAGDPQTPVAVTLTGDNPTVNVPASDPTPQDTPITLKSVTTSIWAKAVAAFGALTGLSINVGNIIETKLSEITLPQALIMVAATGLIIFAIYYFKLRQEAADHQTNKLIDAAASTVQNTVTLQK